MCYGEGRCGGRRGWEGVLGGQIWWQSRAVISVFVFREDQMSPAVLSLSGALVRRHLVFLKREKHLKKLNVVLTGLR